jgi:DNA-binding response OmpR family regulator
MDLRTRRVERDGHEVQLTAGEFAVPANLMRDPDHVLSRELAVRGFESTRGPRCLEVSEIEAPVRCWLQGRSRSTAAAF